MNWRHKDNVEWNRIEGMALNGKERVEQNGMQWKGIELNSQGGMEWNRSVWNGMEEKGAERNRQGEERKG
jgi:hypothetical protein